MSKKNVAISTVEFHPNGADHNFQQLITNLLHRVVMEDERVTLGEIGYLHQNTLMLNQDTQCPELKIYFDARFVYRKVMNERIGTSDLIVVDEMDMFRNWLFVGDVQGVFDVVKLLAPKTGHFEDEIGRTSLQIKKGNKQTKTAVGVMSCNPYIAIAAALDINLADPNFRVQFIPMAKGTSSVIDSIVVSASNRVIPVSIRVSYTARTEVTPENCYDPELAVPYLMQLAEQVQSTEQGRVDMIKKVKAKGKKNKKRTENRVGQGFSKFS